MNNDIDSAGRRAAAAVRERIGNGLPPPPPGPARRRGPWLAGAAVAALMVGAVAVTVTRDRNTDVTATGSTDTTAVTTEPARPTTTTTTEPPSTTPSTPTTPTTAPPAAGWDAYVGLENPTPPPGVIDYGGGLFLLGPPGSGDYSPYGFRSWQAGDVFVTLIDRRGPEGTRQHSVVVEVLAIRLVGHQYVETQDCEVNGAFAPYLITLINTLDVDENGVVAPSAAWLFDPSTEEITEIDATPVTCKVPRPIPE